MYYNSQFELQVRPNGRAAADEYYYNGNWFIEGREGSKYTLWFKNNTNTRVMTILSVDGLDVCKGQPAGPDSDGYIVDAHSSIEIPGWKLDSQTAAEFYFAKIGKSYAHTSGANTNNVGVIGAMVFNERVNYYQMYNNMIHNGGYATLAHSGMSSSLSSIQCSTRGISSAGMNAVGMNNIVASGAIAQNVGTGFGDATQFKTAQVAFEKANPTFPDAMLVLYYNTARNLQKMGIQLRTKNNRYDTSTAQAFPNYTTGCTPPPGWSK